MTVAKTLTMTQDDHYSYRVYWSTEDAEFVGTCTEFPSLSHLAASKAEALAGIEELVQDVVQDMRQAGEECPTPFAERTYSGEFMTRVPGELHRRLAMEATESGISLNRLVSFKLALPIAVGKPIGRGRKRSKSPAAS